MNITDVDINEAEKTLLPKDIHFDDERRDFIKGLESCDLLAAEKPLLCRLNCFVWQDIYL